MRRDPASDILTHFRDYLNGYISYTDDTGTNNIPVYTGYVEDTDESGDRITRYILIGKLTVIEDNSPYDGYDSQCTLNIQVIDKYELNAGDRTPMFEISNKIVRKVVTSDVISLENHYIISVEFDNANDIEDMRETERIYINNIVFNLKIQQK